MLKVASLQWSQNCTTLTITGDNDIKQEAFYFLLVFIAGY